MRIHPLFKWFGSKWQSAKHYPQPEHDLLIEPYAGGAGYALNHSDRKVIIWEEDTNLIALWQWLIQEATPSLIRDIPVGLPIGTDIRTIGLSNGQALLLKNWQRTNGVGNCWTVSSWGHLPGFWTINTRSRVADEIMAIKHWWLENPINYLETPATWFVDPPYLYNYRYLAKVPFDYTTLSKLPEKVSDKSLLIFCEALEKGTGKIPNYLPFVRSHRSITSVRKKIKTTYSDELIYVRHPL